MKLDFSIYRIFFSLLIAFLIGLLFLKTNSNATELTTNNNQKIETNYITKKFDDNIINIIDENEGVVINFYNHALFQKTNNNFLDLNNSFKEISFDNVTDFKIIENIGYFLIGNLIYTSNINDEELELTEISDLNNYGINAMGICVYNNIIYAYGEFNNDAAVISITLDDEELNQIIVGGTNEETFLDAFILDEQIFLIGEKDSISYNSDLQNVGLPNTKKIFMLSYDLKLNQKQNQIYFNQINESEKYINYKIKNDYFYLQLNSAILKIDKNLNLFIQDETVNCDLNNNYYLTNIKNEIKTIVKKDNKIYYKGVFLTEIIGNISLIQTVNGNLIIFTINEKILESYIITEYHINKNETIITNRLYPEINFKNKFVIESYFENLEVEINNLNPNLNIDGIYDITYKVNKEDGTFFLIDGKYELKPFVNIIEGGIYQEKELLFYGNAKLNNVTIYNGHKVKDEGDYELKLTNANNIETIYHFKIIENYYKDDECITLKPDIVVNKNQQFCLNINFKKDNNQTIKELWINEEKYENYEISNDNIIIYLKGDSKYSIKNYHIDKIVYEDEKLIDYYLNENYLVMTLKDTPSIVMEKSIKDRKISLSYDFDDPDKTFSFIKTELYKGNDLVGINYNYFNNKIKIINLDIKKISCKHYLVTFNGNQTITTKIIEYEIENYDHNKFLESSFIIDHSINNLNISIDPLEAKLISLNVSNNDLIKDLKIIKNDLNPLIIIIISGIIIIIGIVLFFIIKNKFQIFKKKKQL